MEWRNPSTQNGNVSVERETVSYLLVAFRI